MKSMWWLVSSSFSNSSGVTFTPCRSATVGRTATTLSTSSLSVWGREGGREGGGEVGGGGGGREGGRGRSGRGRGREGGREGEREGR